MKALLVIKILLLMLFLVTPAYAMQPTEETNCCLLFDDEWTLPEECDQYEINKERCDVIVAEYKSFYNWVNYGSTGILIAVIAFVAWLLWIGVRKLRKKK